jgi:hypothetical protein
MKPTLDFLDTGLMRRQGESVWAPTMAMGPPGRQRAPTAKATMEEPFRVR